MPRGEPESFGTGQPPSTPRASDEVLHLLYRSGLVSHDVAAELHHWLDPAVIVKWVQSAAGSAGTPGFGMLADALGERAPRTHRVARIRVAARDRYRLDYVSGEGRGKPRTVACDGQHRWRLYDDRVAVGPAAPLPDEIAALIDPSWLLVWRLSECAEVTVQGRRCVRFTVAHNPRTAGSWPRTALFSPAVAVVDAELGIALSLTSFVGTQAAIRYELRDITRPDAENPADFRIDAAPGVRTVEDIGSILDEVDAPEPLRLAARAAADIARHAGRAVAAFTSFIDVVGGAGSGARDPG